MSQTQHYNMRKRIKLFYQQDPNYGLRGLQINIQRQLFRDVPSCHLGTPDYSSTSTKNPPSRSVKSSSETKQTALSSTNSQDYI